MEMVIAFVTLLLGLAVGAFIVWFAKDGQSQQAVAAAQAENLATISGLEEKAAALGQREAHLNQELAATRHEMDQRRIRAEDELSLLRQELGRLREEHVQMQAQLYTERQVSSEKQRLLGEMEQRLAQAIGAASQQAIESVSQRAIESVSEKVLENNSQSFLEMARSAIQELRPLMESVRPAEGSTENGIQEGGNAGEIDSARGIGTHELAEMVRPLDETLRKVEDQLRAMEVERSGAYENLMERVKELGDSQTALRAEAGRLASAMRTPVQRGLWGEIQLRRVVEMSGMLEHCEFRVPGESLASQSEHTDLPSLEGSANSVQADLTVHLPGNRAIAVNAQAPVGAYLDALASTDDEDRDRKMGQHAMELRSHIDRLSADLISAGLTEDSDFVVAFLPGEAYLSAALAQDPALLEYSISNRVLLTTPTTLVSLLKTANYGWRQENVAENARQVRELGHELYERLRVLSGHFNGIKRGLETTLRAYNDAAGSMESRVLSTARKFKDLGVPNGHALESPQLVPIGPKEIHLPELRALVGAQPGNGEGD